MKRWSRILLMISILSSAYFLAAQNPLISYSGFPLKQHYSPLFGKDIIINSQPDETQHKVALCRAYNGWLYAVITYKGGVWGTNPAATVLKSTDNGLNWTILIDSFYPATNGEFISVDILVIGNSPTELKIILAFVAASTSHFGVGFASRWDEQTGTFESSLFTNSYCYSISLATDYTYPASNSDPFSVGILYSEYSPAGDSIIFRYSTNGGLSFENRRKVAGYGSRCDKVALAYGRSPSWSSGRYFGVWEVQDGFGSMPGHLYTAHTEPDITSPFTTPVNLDGLDPTYSNNCKNPSIACQYNDMDNDSSNLSEVILFEKYNPATLKSDIRGYYNLQAGNHSKFKKLFLSDSLHKNLSPDINFNPYDSTFMITYYDSTIQKLPFLTNNFNLRNPNVWDVISTGYNDSTNLSAPYPKIEATSTLQSGANTWIADGPGGIGVAMFDAPSSTYTGISEISKTNETSFLGAYPNPCTKEIKFSFYLKKTREVCIELLTILGQSLGTITDQTYLEGKHIVQYNVSYLPQGTFIYHFKSDDFVAVGKIFIVR